MQKIQMLIGSPRKRGNTSLMAGMLNEGLNTVKYSSDTKYLYDFDIKPCVDCRGCKKDKKECILKDDMSKIYPALEDAEIIIIGTPIYWFGPSAKMKLLLDRLRPYYDNKRLAGKSMALLLPAATGAADCDLTIEMFKRSADALEMKYLGTATAKAYDVGEVKNDNKAGDLIADLVAQISGVA